MPRELKNCLSIANKVQQKLRQCTPVLLCVDEMWRMIKTDVSASLPPVAPSLAGVGVSWASSGGEDCMLGFERSFQLPLLIQPWKVFVAGKEFRPARLSRKEFSTCYSSRTPEENYFVFVFPASSYHHLGLFSRELHVAWKHGRGAIANLVNFLVCLRLRREEGLRGKKKLGLEV